MGYYDLLQDTREKHCITIENIVLHRNCEGEEVVGRYEAGLTAKLVHLVEVAPVGIERVVALRTLDNKGCVRNRRQGECLKAVAAGLGPITLRRVHPTMVPKELRYCCAPIEA